MKAVIKCSNHDPVENSWDFVSINGKEKIDIFHPTKSNREFATINWPMCGSVDVKTTEDFIKALQLAVKKAKQLDKRYKGLSK